VTAAPQHGLSRLLDGRQGRHDDEILIHDIMGAQRIEAMFFHGWILVNAVEEGAR
jgi:hypothetical protein